MKVKQIFITTLFTLAVSLLVACGGGATGGNNSSGSSGNAGKKQASQKEVQHALKNLSNPADKKTSILGKKIAETKGDITYGLPRGIDSMVIALTPYEQGFKVFFHSLIEDDPEKDDEHEHVCGGAFVVQNGKVLYFRIADNQAEYVNDNSNFSYKGYVESGFFDSCGHYDKDTVWVVNAGYFNGFDPLQPYTFILTSVGSVKYDDLAKIDISIEGKTDNTKTDKNYLGKKTGESVTKKAYQRAYPAKKFAFNATITPYERGFRILAESSDAQMCFVKSEVYQDGAVYDIGVIDDSWYKYFSEDRLGSGYVESGFFSSCEDLPVDTTFVVNASSVGFNPKRPYSVKLGSVEINPETEERQVFEIKPNK